MFIMLAEDVQQPLMNVMPEPQDDQVPQLIPQQPLNPEEIIAEEAINDYDGQANLVQIAYKMNSFSNLKVKACQWMI
jgi:hypothetical protein